MLTFLSKAVTDKSIGMFSNSHSEMMALEYNPAVVCIVIWVALYRIVASIIGVNLSESNHMRLTVKSCILLA